MRKCRFGAAIRARRQTERLAHPHLVLKRRIGARVTSGNVGAAVIRLAWLAIVAL